MNDVTVRRDSKRWPPIIFAAAIVVSILLKAFYPLPWFGLPLSEARLMPGSLTLTAFLALNAGPLHPPSSLSVVRRTSTNRFAIPPVVTRMV